MNPRQTVLACASVALLAGCATTPEPGDAPGRETFEVLAYANEATGSGRYFPEAGVHCVLANDRGSWEVVTPARVTVERSREPLRLRCAKPGFLEGSGTIACLSEQARATARAIGQVAGFATEMAIAPAAVATMGPPGPAPMAAGSLLAGTVVAAVAEASGRAAFRGTVDDCTYLARRDRGRLHAYLLVP